MKSPSSTSRVLRATEVDVRGESDLTGAGTFRFRSQ